jgi:hypothetical protein
MENKSVVNYWLYLYIHTQLFNILNTGIKNIISCQFFTYKYEIFVHGSVYEYVTSI